MDSTAAPVTRSAARSASAWSAWLNWYGRDGDLQPQLLREAEELIGVPAGVRGHAAQRPFLEEVLVIVQRRNVAEMDTGYRQGAAAIEGGQRGRHDVAHGREDDP